MPLEQDRAGRRFALRRRRGQDHRVGVVQIGVDRGLHPGVEERMRIVPGLGFGQAELCVFFTQIGDRWHGVGSGSRRFVSQSHDREAALSEDAY